MIKIYILNIKNLSFDESMISLITTKRRRLIDETKNIERKIKHLYTDILVRYAFGNEQQVPFESLDYDNNGKPIYHEDYDVSISHSRDFIVVGISNSKPFGIDIQKMEAKYLSLSKRIMDENTYFEFGNSSDQLVFFFKQWTAKEAFFKMLGTGIVSNLKKVTIEEDVIKNNDVEGFVSYKQIDDYMISLVTDIREAYKYIELNIEDIKKEI